MEQNKKLSLSSATPAPPEPAPAPPDPIEPGASEPPPAVATEPPTPVNDDTLSISSEQPPPTGDSSATGFNNLTPEEQNYLQYVQAVLAEQGVDFNDWSLAIMEQAAGAGAGSGSEETEAEEEESVGIGVDLNSVDAGWWEAGPGAGTGVMPIPININEGENLIQDWEDGHGQELGEEEEEEEEEAEEHYEEEEAEELDEADKDVDYTMEEDPPLDNLMGMSSYRFLQSRILAGFIQDDENERMIKIQKRLKGMKKVKAPEVAKFPSIDFLKEPEIMEDFQRNESMSELSKDGEPEPPKKEFTAREWALKSAMSFLKIAGCRRTGDELGAKRDEEEPAPHRMSAKSAKSATSAEQLQKSQRLAAFMKSKSGRRRRVGIHSAPEITSAIRRAAERSMWRSVIENSKPKYPLPRFILPRHRYLRKIEEELIGPGSYELDYYEKQRLKRLAAMPSMFRSCTSRFPKEKVRSPGADFISDPYEIWEKACEHKKHPGMVPLFQSTPCNFRYKDFYVGCGLSPAHYYLDSPMDEFISTVKSKRSMYEQGSGVEDSFCRKPKIDYASRLGPGAYDIRKSIAQELSDSYSCFKGKISGTERRKMYGFKAAFENPLWPPENGNPGPDAYDPYNSLNGGQWMEPAWAPFGNLAKARTDNKKEQSSRLIAPDYYFYYGVNIPPPKNEKMHVLGDGMKSNFLSKTPMTTPQIHFNAIKERIQPKNHKLAQELLFAKKVDECSTTKK